MIETNQSFQVGDKVRFEDEHGTPQVSIITRIVPQGEYSADEIGYAITGTYGSYVRVAADIELVEPEK